MMRRLFENTVISAVSFAVISILNFLIVPIIVGGWGLTEFGLLVLMRAFLPVGFMGVVDLGVSELAGQSVARARANGDWQWAGQRITVALVVSAVVSGAVGLALVFGDGALAALFRVDAQHRAAFSSIVYATAAANLVVFPGLVGEGIVKGFERFPALRMLEIGSNVIFVLGALAAVYAGGPFQWAAYAFLIGLVMRGVLVWIIAAYLCRRAGLVLGARPDPQTRRDSLSYCWLLSQGKILGALQFPVLPLIVGALFGPRAVGVYDVLVRLPRFCKAILSILNTALLPVSARLDGATAMDQLQRLGRAGLVILPAVTVPPLIGGAVFSEPILRLWVGPTVAIFWPWMALMFVVPVVAQYLSFGNSIMIARPNVLLVLNRLLLAQLVIMAVVTYLALGRFEERAFIVGQAVSWLALLPWQLKVLSRELGIAYTRVVHTILIQIALMAPLAVGVYALSAWLRLNSLFELSITFATWCGALWVAQYFALLGKQEREEVVRMMSALVGFGRRKAVSG